MVPEQVQETRTVSVTEMKQETRERKYTASTFSFNIAGGRCETCEGAGYQEVEMVFMADVFVPCDECEGKRFKPEVLEVKYFGKRIVDVLEMTVDEAIRFFPHEEKLGQALWQVQQVGLGYLRLGQPATTLSGGEAQRLKIARELTFSAKQKGRKLYIMDEPTTGLHLEDIRKLAQVLDRLVEAGHTVVLIEHSVDLSWVHPGMHGTADAMADIGADDPVPSSEGDILHRPGDLFDGGPRSGGGDPCVEGGARRRNERRDDRGRLAHVEVIDRDPIKIVADRARSENETENHS